MIKMYDKRVNTALIIMRQSRHGQTDLQTDYDTHKITNSTLTQERKSKDRPIINSRSIKPHAPFSYQKRSSWCLRETNKRQKSLRTTRLTHKLGRELPISLDVPCHLTTSVQKCHFAACLEDEWCVTCDDCTQMAHLVHFLWVITHVVQGHVHEHLQFLHPI